MQNTVEFWKCACSPDSLRAPDSSSLQMLFCHTEHTQAVHSPERLQRRCRANCNDSLPRRLLLSRTCVLLGSLASTSLLKLSWIHAKHGRPWGGDSCVLDS